MTRFIFLISEFYSLIECAHKEWMLGVGNESEVKKLVTQTSSVLKTPGGRFWWRAQSHLHPQDIRDYLDPIFREYTVESK
jgi:hypothetical protein